MDNNQNLKFQINKKLLLLVIILIILFIILQIVKLSKEQKYLNIKLDENKSYVYTKYHSDTNMSNIPYINIIGLAANNVNEEIVNISKNYLTSTDKNKTVTYRYNQNKNILSLVLSFRDINESNQLYYTYKTYVFDLKDKCKLLTNDEIINKFSISYAEVNDVMAGIMKEKYNDELNKGYIDKNKCDYTCYINLRNIYNYIDNANYYIENGHLVVYRAYDVYSDYKEEEYFSRNDFKFIIK